MDKVSEQNKVYLSSKDAGAILGYTHDYISRLCRQNHMVGIQKGREWYVTREELDAFKQRHEVELIEKKKILSKKFSRIRLEHEAKKRKARESAQVVPQISRQAAHKKPTPTKERAHSVESLEEISGKQIKFVFPRELAAVCVLAVLLLAPHMFNALTSTSTSVSSAKNQTANSSFSIKDVGTSIEDGIQDTIYTQSTVVEPVAAVFGFAPYLADGYWQFFMEVGKLPGETYARLKSIGNGYLTLYLMQGEALYYSVQNLNTMGASVLRGYELIGEAFLFGSKDIIHTYTKILNVESPAEVGKGEIRDFAANVQGGFGYATQTGLGDFCKSITTQIGKLFESCVINVGRNVSAMRSTVSQISHNMNAYIGSLFDFRMVKNDSNIRTIELEN